MLIHWHRDGTLVDAEVLAVMRRVTIRHARRSTAVACDLHTHKLLYLASLSFD